jgi:hypothetical protein
MFNYRDEYMLLSLSGRVETARRAEPAHRHRLSPADLKPAAVRPARGRLRRWAPDLRPAIGAGRRRDRGPAQPPAVGSPVDGESYFELEFAVGFAVEDEQFR